MSMLRCYSIYQNPRDYPGKIVVRGTTIAGGTCEPDETAVYIGESLNDARAVIEALDPNLICFPRDENDEPQIVETWL
jgi:hypothetical protein